MSDVAVALAQEHLDAQQQIADQQMAEWLESFQAAQAETTKTIHAWYRDAALARMTTEERIRAAREAYATDKIEIEEFESRVADALRAG